MAFHVCHQVVPGPRGAAPEDFFEECVDAVVAGVAVPGPEQAKGVEFGLRHLTSHSSQRTMGV